MDIRIYFSRSFGNLDKEVHSAIRAACEDRRIADKFNLSLLDSSNTTGEQLGQRIAKDIKAADLVVCVYCRRHRIHGSRPPRFTAPPYVVSEAAFALSQGKELALFVEQGVDLAELGLLDAVNLQSEPFARGNVRTAEFRSRTTAFIQARLRAFQQTTKQPYRCRKYEVHHTVYPNGYALTHFKTTMEALEPSQSVPVRFATRPSSRFARPTRLPSAESLMRAGARSEYHVPHDAFVAFATEQEGVRFDRARRKEGAWERNFLVRFPDVGTFSYQWMWGVPQFLHPKEKFNALGVNTSRMGIDAVDLKLRIHRGIRRDHVPRLGAVTVADLIQFEDMEALRQLYDRADLSQGQLPERTPLFNCYSYSVDVARGTDLVLLY